MLTEEQKKQYELDGYVLVSQVVSGENLQAMRVDLDNWIEQSKVHVENYGEMVNGKARFDLEDGHCAETPRLRRIASPVDISAAYRDVLFNGAVVEAVADIVGTNVKFHHCKLNIKLPGMKTRVDYHQDQSFEVHTNEDYLTLLVLLDDMSEENGCLRVLKSSHLGPRYSHYEGDEFVGKVERVIQEQCNLEAIKIEGKAGDICLMSSWCLHGGTANMSQNPRRLLICGYSAADNYPLMPPMVPSDHSGRIVAGKASYKVRFREGVLELPKHYQSDSFFGAQGQKGIQKETNK
jgi:ectoine hydroxylase-related dioxygenase (phytanoyl-CoA dioxygenase family)